MNEKEETKFVDPPKKEQKKAPVIDDPDKELREKIEKMIDAGEGKTDNDKRFNYELMSRRSVQIAAYLGVPNIRVKPILNSILKIRIDSL